LILQVLVRLFLLLDFGANLAKGAIKGVKESGLLGAFTGGTKAAAGRHCCSNFLWIRCISHLKTKNEKAIAFPSFEGKALIGII